MFRHLKRPNTSSPDVSFKKLKLDPILKCHLNIIDAFTLDNLDLFMRQPRNRREWEYYSTCYKDFRYFQESEIPSYYRESVNEFRIWYRSNEDYDLEYEFKYIYNAK